MEKSNNIVIRVCIIAALAGLLFGLDIAYVNGALEFIVKDFNLTEEQSQQVAGILLTGAAVGALGSGWLSRTFGRKKILVLSAIIFTLFTIAGVLSHAVGIFLVTRFVLGLAIGIASFVAPLYLSEIAPHKIRGGLIAMYQLMITIGIFLMFVSNAALHDTGSWRLMLAVLLIPSVIMLIGTLTLPESPRWLLLVGRAKDAENVLTKIRTSKDEVDFEMSEIKQSLVGAENSFKLLRHPYFLKVLMLGVLLQALQQFSGMNAFMYYSSKIFMEAGINNPATATIVVGLVNVLTTFLAIKYVDKLGRKPIMYFGLTLLITSCAIDGYIFHLQAAGLVLSPALQYTLLSFCLLFIFAFAISLGPIVWILCSEIYPLEGRDLGITVSTMANWIFNAILGSYTLTWFKTMGVSGTFWLFGGVCLAGFILINRFTPETKDVPLEELEFNLKANKKLRDIGKRVH
jgi:SP family galactose:H+ symporter-like MFS transporter